ncbi:MAG: hypothetical protein GF370_04955 [Candidatus Nealsonbacteria bacterium]|nr:hypothetical protein [Candidatus Nealsonbacteria bacterium]
MKKIKLNKGKFLIGLAVAFISLRVYFGALFGYFFAKFLADRLSSVVLTFGSYNFHFHHWMMGLVGLIFFFLYSFSPTIEQLIFGFLSGLVFEGITSYSDWYRILWRPRA